MDILNYKKTEDEIKEWLEWKTLLKNLKT
jgi:hypothetical protein